MMGITGGLTMATPNDEELPLVGNFEEWIAAEEARIEADEARIAVRRALVDDLRQAVRKHAPALAGPGHSVPTAQVVPGSGTTPRDAHASANDMASKSILQAAEIILRERPDGAEFSDIARIAMGRGYRSIKSGDNAVTITRSFYEMMRRARDRFIRDDTNKKWFRLAARGNAGRTMPRAAVAPIQSRRDEPPPRTRNVERLMVGTRGPITTQEIVETLKKAGDFKGISKKEAWRLVDSIMRRGVKAGAYRKVGTATWEMDANPQESGRDTRASTPVRVHSATPGDSPIKSANYITEAEVILRDHGGPMETAELLDAIAERGAFEMTAVRVNQRTALRTALARHPEMFHRDTEGRWDLAERHQSPSNGRRPMSLLDRFEAGVQKPDRFRLTDRDHPRNARTDHEEDESI
jgi:hypothetical protein